MKCVSIYIQRYLRLGPHEFLFRDYNFVIFFQLGDSVRNKCHCKQSLSTVEIKGSLSFVTR